MTENRLEMPGLQEELIQFAVGRWGWKNQLRMLQEECAEVIQASNHILRGIPESQRLFGSELADLYITLAQGLYIYRMVLNRRDFEEHLERKVDRLRVKIETDGRQRSDFAA